MLMVLFDIVSYKMTETVLMNNYTNSVSNTLNSLKNFLDFGLSSVSDKSLD